MAMLRVVCVKTDTACHNGKLVKQRGRVRVQHGPALSPKSQRAFRAFGLHLGK